MVQIPWRTGVNMREFAYYGTPAVPHTDSGLQRRQLDQLQALQVKLIRFYASFNQFSTDQCAQKVSAALDLLKSYDMQAVVCLVDSLSSPFTLAADGGFHTGPMGHITKQYWHQRAYQTNFIPFATGIARACGQHPALLMWELGNEYAIHPQPASWEDGQAFLEFARTASEALKKAAPQTLVSTGLVGTHHVAPAGMAEQYGRQLYSLPTLDAISIHYYADDGEKMSAQREVSLANGLGKPFYVGEFGAPDNWPNRAQFYQAELQEWNTDGALTALPWAFDSSQSDVGVSDTKAFAAIRPDFASIKDSLRLFGRAVDPVVLKPIKVADQPITSPKKFVVVKGPVYIRSAPTLAPGTKTQGRWLSFQQTVDVDATSRTESEGYVWWRHQEGWSAERSLDNRQVFMVEAQPVSGDTAVATKPAADKTVVQPSDLATFMPTHTKTFMVIDGPVSWRTAPTLEPRVLIRGKVWRTGQKVAVDATSRTESEGYVWWRHQDGWSAERSMSTPPQILMVEEGMMLDAAALFARLPLDLGTIQWTQYYGNTTFAFEHGKDHNYDGYSQGLHGGLDLGHSAGAPVQAGIGANLNPVCTYVGNERSFTPNRVDIQVGQYLVILGHLANPDFSLVGKTVTPDTIVGFIDGGAGHVHIEIRRGNKILNPLSFIPAVLRDSLFARFSPASDFQPNNGQWESALDQPDITIGGGLIGPRKTG